MNKKAFIIIITAMTVFSTQAQNTWEVPNSEKNKEVPTENVAVKEKKSTNTEDAQYLTGAVPEKDGKVVFTFEKKVEGADAATLYDKTYEWMEKLTKAENQLNSRIALVNKAEQKIVATFSEWLEFSRSIISVDRTRLDYVMVAECVDNLVTIELSRIKFHYDEERPTRMDVSAEEWISDSKALNKDGSKIIRGRKKFRKKTIERMNEIGNSLIMGVKAD